MPNMYFDVFDILSPYVAMLISSSSVPRVTLTDIQPSCTCFLRQWRFDLFVTCHFVLVFLFCFWLFRLLVFVFGFLFIPCVFFFLVFLMAINNSAMLFSLSIFYLWSCHFGSLFRVQDLSSLDCTKTPFHLWVLDSILHKVRSVVLFTTSKTSQTQDYLLRSETEYVSVL